MKANEFITEEIVTEYSTIDPGIKEVLLKKGYKQLGEQGADQMAFSEPGTGQVLKIFGTDHRTAGSSGEKISASQRMFEVWADYCKQNVNNKFLPRFSGFTRFVFDDHTYYQIRMERLQPVDRELGESLWSLSQTITTFPGETFRHTVEILTNGESEGTYQTLVSYLGKPGADKMIYTVMDLYNIADQNGYRLDLHNENYMMRGETPVIVDPWIAYG